MFPGIPYKMTLINKNSSCQMVPLHRHRFLNHRNWKRRFNSRNLKTSHRQENLFSKNQYRLELNHKPFCNLKERLKSK
jgi:hypothetical protein